MKKIVDIETIKIDMIIGITMRERGGIMTTGAGVITEVETMAKRDKDIIS